jgi:peptide/nickel transport system substrate-binding protein
MIPARRHFLAQLGALGLAALAAPPRALAMGRTPLGGRIALHVPWPTAAIDPQALHDPGGALFGAAIADSLFALDPSTGAPYPTLAAALPTREGADTIVRLREGLRTARLVGLDARDLIASVERARRRGAGALLAQVPRPVAHKSDALAANFGPVDPGHLMRALASPLCALLPQTFDPGKPDGTGAFRADIVSTGITLSRNVNAARGAAFLDGIDIAPAENLQTSLRAFEAERDDIGWLGLGLHADRKGAQRFDLGRAAWIVLAVSPDAGASAVPGAAQRLVDAIPPERLAHLGLGPLPSASGDPGWTGPPADLLVDTASPHLVEVAEAVAPILSRPGHEVTVARVARGDIASRFKSKPSLAIHLVRPLGPSALHTLLALATTEDLARGRDLGKSPPKLAGNPAARALTSSLRVGVLGELRIAGGVIPDLAFARGPSGEGWDLGATFRRPAKR